MKKFLALLFSLAFWIISGQFNIKVLKTGEDTPIPNATISCNGKNIGKTNHKGILQFNTKCKNIDVKAEGFYESDVKVEKEINVSLTKIDPKTKLIETVIISDKSDPHALEILQKVNDNYKNNSPKSLDSYAFRSYEKISLDFDQDSIQHYNRYFEKRLDSLKMLPEKKQSTKKKKDSIENETILKIMKDSKFFLWERVSEFLFSQKYGEKINVLDNRVAGLQQPLYEMLALRTNRNQIPKEIRKENRSLYRFFLTDTIEIEGRKNFVIRFRQADYTKPTEKRKFNGYLYIDIETFGLKKIESSDKKNEGKITSIWIPINNKWFLSKENFKVKMGTAFDTKEDNTKNNDKKNYKFGSYIYVIADYFDYKTPIEENKKYFEGYTMSVKNSDGKSIENFRTDSLSQREKMAYEKIDSIGKQYKLDQKLGILAGLIKGDIRIGKVDFDAIKIINYNEYEGVRLGLAAKLNENFNRYISPDVYFAYGFKDHSWKFGAGINVRTTLEKNSFFRVEYFNDVGASGRFHENLWNYKMKIMNAGVDLNNYRFYHFEGLKFSYEYDFSNALTMKISAKKSSEEAKFDYDYRGLGKRFQNFANQITIKYAPNSGNIMTPAGKLTYEQSYPEIYANYEQGIKTLGGDFSYSRFDFLLQHQFKTKIGVTGVRLYGGLLLGNTPVWHHFSIDGLSSESTFMKLNFTSYLGFATMEGGKYFNDKLVGYYLTHRIPFYFKARDNISSFDVVYKAVIGDMKNPKYHNFQFEKLDHLYQEIGVEYNHFLGTAFNLGFFYRIGHYATGNFKENFALQLKLNFLGF